MAYYDDLRAQAHDLQDAINDVAATKVSPIVQELVNASEHIDAIFFRLEVVQGYEESPEEEPGR